MTESSEIYWERQQHLLKLIDQTPIDAVALNPGPSMDYFTGMHFHLSERPVLFILAKENPARIILPELEASKAANLPYDCQVFTYRENPETWQGSFSKAFTEIISPINVLGIEPRYLRFLETTIIRSALPGAKLQPAGELIGTPRMVKDADEIHAMQTAVDIAQVALGVTLPHIKPGVTEKHIAALLTSNLYASGSEPRLPFTPIVASGPNSANPHAFPTDRELQAGDLLIIDWGASVNGYYSDLTRTFAIGEVEPELVKIAEIVHQANQAGFEVSKPGMEAGKIDIAARKVISDAGFGQYFTHRTGHGLGLDGHEPPYIRGDNDFILKPGMTFTIEPGIYIEGRGGVRIEDDAVITKDGVRSLSSLPRQLITLQ